MGELTGRSLTGKTIAGKYRVGERLSDDPAGVIYKGVDLSTQGDVLVLSIAPGVGLAGEEGARSLGHPNLLQHRFSYFPNEAQRFVVVDAPAGRSLARVIAKRGPLHPGPSANVALQILSALHAIHSQGGHHGDLNPHDVFLSKTPKGELDVRLLFPGALRPDPAVPSPRYLAPEQIRGEEGDRRSDLWSVGAILYFCLFGRPPFDGNSREEITGKILLKDPIFPQKAATLPAELVQVIGEALAKDPGGRPQFANNMIGDLLATAEEFDEQMTALVAQVLRASIPPTPAAANKAPAKPAAPKPAAPKPEPPKAAPVKAAPKPAVTKAEPVKAAPVRTASEEEPPRPEAVSVLEAARHAASLHGVAAPSGTVHGVPVPPPEILAAGAQTQPLAAAAADGAATSPGAGDPEAEAREISAALEGALEIDLGSFAPAAEAARKERRPLLAGRRKLVVAALCLLAVVAGGVALAVLPGGGEPGPQDGAAAPAPTAPPPETAIAEPVTPPVPPPPPPEPPSPAPVPEPAPAAPPQEPPPEPAIADPVAQPAAGVAREPAPGPGSPDEPTVEKKAGGAPKPGTGKKPQTSKGKKAPDAPKGAAGLASNPFGG